MNNTKESILCENMRANVRVITIGRCTEREACAPLCIRDNLKALSFGSFST